MMWKFKLSRRSSKCLMMHMYKHMYGKHSSREEILENELENAKAIVGTFKSQNEDLEQQIQSLKM